MRRLIVLVTVAALSMLGLITVGGGAAIATTPGKNGLILFHADTGSGAQLYTIKPNGTDLRQLTHVSGAEAVNAEWSPDGRRIAFELAAETHASVVIMNADGTGIRDLTPPRFRSGFHQPAFTPDGHHLVAEVCIDQPTGDGIFIMRDDGTGLRRLTANPFPAECDSDPNVSPDGTTVTFVRHKVDGLLQALYAVNIDGSHLRKLVPYRYEVAIKHDWAPDGRHIVITTDADYPNGRSPNVATVRPDGTHLRLLTHYRSGAWGAFAGSYSPDGRWIVFRIENLEREQYKLMKMYPDGSHRKVIAELPFRPRHSDWGPRPSHHS
jgi:Tol biopolymer transport system component